MHMLKPGQPLKKPLAYDVCLPVYDLRVGMFVSDVDCGWKKTPFMLEGVLITEKRQIEILQKVAQYVNVDPTRSQDAALKEYLERILSSGKYFGLQEADTLGGMTIAEKNLPPGISEPSLALQNAIATGDTPSSVTSSGFNAGRESAKGGTSWWKRFLPGTRPKVRTQSREALPPPTRPAYVPPEIPLVSYPQPEFNWLAVPASLDACKTTVRLLDDITTGISLRHTTDIRKVERAAESLALHMIAHPSAMMWAAKIHQTDNRLYQRSLEAGIYLTAMGRHLGFGREPLADLAMIGILLDLGKTQLTPSLLEKQGRYNNSEMQRARQHVDLGVAMLSESESDMLPPAVLRAIAEHHEQVDGKGYPKGLSAPEISIYGRMAAVVDGYVAMINPRPYAETYSPFDAIKQLFAGADNRWFSPLIEQFVQSIGVFPIGSLVELNSGHVAIVIQHNPLRRLEPRILLVTHKDKTRRTPPMQIDMFKHNARSKRRNLQIRKGLTDGSYGIDARDFYFGTQ